MKENAIKAVLAAALGALASYGTQLIVPAIILIVGYTANCFITGKLESRLFGYGRKEGMLIASPAGASDMALIMEDLRVQNVDVVIMQVLRAAVVMALFPQIVNIVCFALGG